MNTPTTLSTKQMRLLKTKFGKEKAFLLTELFDSQISLPAKTGLPREKFFKIAMEFHGSFEDFKLLIGRVNAIRASPFAWNKKKFFGSGAW